MGDPVYAVQYRFAVSADGWHTFGRRFRSLPCAKSYLRRMRMLSETDPLPYRASPPKYRLVTVREAFEPLEAETGSKMNER